MSNCQQISISLVINVQVNVSLIYQFTFFLLLSNGIAQTLNLSDSFMVTMMYVHDESGLGYHIYIFIIGVV